jgi:ribose transport system permease protein
VRSWKKLVPLLLAIGILLILFRVGVPGVLKPVPMFWKANNLLDLAQQISVNAIIAFGMTLTILIGGIDLSVGAVLALVGTTTVYVLHLGAGSAHGTAWLLLGILAGASVAAAFGAFNGVLAARTKMPPFIITLATMLVARGAALRFNESRPIPIPDEQALFLELGNGRLFGVLPYPVLVMGGIFLAAAILLHRTRFGQHLYAIGGNREAARYTGIPLARTEVAVYVICSLLGGVAGLIQASQLYSAQPASGIGFELSAIAAAVVGGTSFSGGIGTMWGTLIGAVIIGILDKGLNQAGVHHSFQSIAKGAVILGAVYLDVRRRR